MDAAAKDGTNTMGMVISELKEAIGKKGEEGGERIIAKDNIMYMHVVSDVQKHARIVTAYYARNSDLFSLDFDLTVTLAHNIQSMEKDMMERNGLIKRTIN